MKKCCICGKKIIGYGNNPWPVVKDEDSVCCDSCNSDVVIPARIKLMFENDYDFDDNEKEGDVE